MDQSTEQLTAYDETPYCCYPYPQTHPARLAATATLFGMRPADVRRARVLEMGCGDGANLIGLADAFPEAQFVGVDASVRQVNSGQESVAALDLPNLQLRHANILDINESWGKFDYILCHGVFSWVPAEVREHILRTCRERLAPQGVAYVSYNTYPGWHLRGVVRDILWYHVRKFSSPTDKTRHSRALLDFLVKSVPQVDNAYGRLLADEMNLLRDKADAYLLHEHLEATNRPYYFHEFMQLAEKHQLRYLGEADVASMHLGNFAPQVEGILKHLSQEELELEQYADFVRKRTFRQTLLCHAETALHRLPKAEQMNNLWVASPLKEGSVEQGETKFECAAGSIKTASPTFKLAMEVISRSWPGSVAFVDLVEKVRAGLAIRSEVTGEQPVEEFLASQIWTSYLRRFVELYSVPLPFTTEIAAFPRISRLARWQAGRSNVVFTRKHQTMQLDDLAREIIRRLDGRCEVASIVQDLQKMMDDGRVKVEANKTLSREQLSSALRQAVDQLIKRFAFDGILTPESEADPIAK